MRTCWPFATGCHGDRQPRIRSGQRAAGGVFAPARPPVLAANIDNRQGARRCPLRLQGLLQLFDVSRPGTSASSTTCPSPLLGITLQMAAIASPDPHTRFHGIEETFLSRASARSGPPASSTLSCSATWVWRAGQATGDPLPRAQPHRRRTHPQPAGGIWRRSGSTAKAAIPLMVNGWPSCTPPTAPSVSGCANSPSTRPGTRVPKPRPAGGLPGSLARLPASCGAALREPAPELEQHLARRYRPELETMTRRGDPAR